MRSWTVIEKHGCSTGLKAQSATDKELEVQRREVIRKSLGILAGIMARNLNEKQQQKKGVAV